jgi:hypothetical protein
MTAGTMGNGGYFQIANFGSAAYLGGYAFSYNDSPTPPNTGTCTTGATTTCNDPTALCISGTLGMTNPPTYSCYGGGFGINVGQMMGSMTNSPISLAGTTKINYALSGFNSIPGGMRIQVTEGGMTYCATITTATGSVPWTSLAQTCYDTPPGTALAGAPMALTNIQFSIDDAATAGSGYEVCVTSLSVQ